MLQMGWGILASLEDLESAAFVTGREGTRVSDSNKRKMVTKTCRVQVLQRCPLQ